MSYDGKLMRRAMVRFEEAKQRRADALHARERAVYAAVPRIAEIDAAYPLTDEASRAANTAPYFHALSASTTDFTVTVDGQAAEAGAYISLYDAATESFSDAPSLPPQGTGYIELVCMVPTGWQQMTVTYNPTFASGKSITFVMSASDLKNS